jgi:hypothetical protein
LEPDDVRYYVADGLLRFEYRNPGYVTVTVSSPLGGLVVDRE